MYVWRAEVQNESGIFNYIYGIHRYLDADNAMDEFIAMEKNKTLDIYLRSKGARGDFIVFKVQVVTYHH